jgi:hypothetical protein
MANSNILSFYTPTLIIGGLIIAVLVFICCRLRKESRKTEDLKRRSLYGKLMLGMQIMSWIVFVFFLMMVIIGF